MPGQPPQDFAKLPSYFQNQSSTSSTPNTPTTGSSAPKRHVEKSDIGNPTLISSTTGMTPGASRPPSTAASSTKAAGSVAGSIPVGLGSDRAPSNTNTGRSSAVIGVTMIALSDSSDQQTATGTGTGAGPGTDTGGATSKDKGKGQGNWI
ncbi:hypothetical protein IAU59_005034 [Kwoniella sp. CBS 9459]